jgi:hypothetical protein
MLGCKKNAFSATVKHAPEDNERAEEKNRIYFEN